MSEPNPVLNACGFCHDMAIIASQPAPDQVSAIPHTIALYRCRKCSMHVAMMHVGKWEFADFHRSEMEQMEKDAKA